MKLIMIGLFLCFSAVNTVHAQLNKVKSPQVQASIDQQMRQRLKNADDSLITVKFNHAQTLDDLVQLKTNLAVKGVSLTYRKLQFDENGLLEAIDFFVDCNNNSRGQDSIENVKDGTHGFICNLKISGRYQVYIGNVEKAKLIK